MLKIRVENVVASTQIAEELPLDEMAIGLDSAEYDPATFPGLIYRVRDPKAALLLFRSGKVVCTGAKSVDSVREVIRNVSSQLEELGIAMMKKPTITIQNIVATCDMGARVNLNQIAVTLGLENIEYEPEQFPGLVYRRDVPKVVMLLFVSGKVVCTGGRSVQDVQQAVDSLATELQETDLLPRGPASHGT